MWLWYYSGCSLTFINENVLFRWHFGRSVVLIKITSWVSLTSTAHSPAGNVAPRARASEVQPRYVPLTRYQDVVTQEKVGASQLSASPLAWRNSDRSLAVTWCAVEACWKLRNAPLPRRRTEVNHGRTWAGPAASFFNFFGVTQTETLKTGVDNLNFWKWELGKNTEADSTLISRNWTEGFCLFSDLIINFWLYFIWTHIPLINQKINIEPTHNLRKTCEAPTEPPFTVSISIFGKYSILSVTWVSADRLSCLTNQIVLGVGHWEVT